MRTFLTVLFFVCGMYVFPQGSYIKNGLVTKIKTSSDTTWQTLPTPYTIYIDFNFNLIAIDVADDAMDRYMLNDVVNLVDSTNVNIYIFNAVGGFGEPYEIKLVIGSLFIISVKDNSKTTSYLISNVRDGYPKSYEKIIE